MSKTMMFTMMIIVIIVCVLYTTTCVSLDVRLTGC